MSLGSSHLIFGALGRTGFAVLAALIFGARSVRPVTLDGARVGHLS